MRRTFTPIPIDHGLTQLILNLQGLSLQIQTVLTKRGFSQLIIKWQKIQISNSLYSFIVNPGSEEAMMAVRETAQ
ncbi:hypothetical protein A3197_02075 [Candidatus Thiodiazotropha endoloripes]|nr:hypothetical protein A3197_02075 [Candidatus Thiodiazotropha endoloripes]